MRIHYLQHVAFEGLGSMAAWFQQRGHKVQGSHLYRGDTLPLLEDFDWLVIMGGPMGVADDSAHPWLAQERAFIGNAVAAGKMVLGICLGAQLIAAALGAAVAPNRHREIGWHRVFAPLNEPVHAYSMPVLAAGLVFHWHQESYELPTGAMHLAASDACLHQAFAIGERVVGLQYHLETTAESARALIENCGDELDGSHYVQDAEEILTDHRRFDAINSSMIELLDAMERQYPS